MKQFLVRVASYVILIAIIIVLVYLLQGQGRELDRLQINQEVLLDSVKFYQTENGKSVASVKELQLKKYELEQYCSDLTQQVKALGIKLRKIEAIAQAGTETKINVKTIVKDSLIYIDRYNVDTIKSVHWCDSWTDMYATINKDSLEARITSRDTLTAVVHRKKKCLFKKAEYRLDITSCNPHNSIVYERYVKVIK